MEQGAAGRAVAAHIRRIRESNGWTLHEMSDRLTRYGRPILPSGLSKIEAGTRRVDVDDLVAIAAALGVMPDRLLRNPDGSRMDGFPSMTKDDYEDSVAVAGRFMRRILQRMPEADREEYEALRRGDEDLGPRVRPTPKEFEAMTQDTDG